MSIAHKEFETVSTVLPNRVCFDLFFSNLQRCNRVLPESKPGSSQCSEDANLEHPLRISFCRTNESENQPTSDSTNDDANFHKPARIPGIRDTVKDDRCLVLNS